MLFRYSIYGNGGKMCTLFDSGSLQLIEGVSSVSIISPLGPEFGSIKMRFQVRKLNVVTQKGLLALRFLLETFPRFRFSG